MSALMEEKIKNFYKKHNYNLSISARKLAVIYHLMPYLQHGPKILDVGCGDGYITAAMSLFGDVTGFDLDVEIQKKRWPTVKFVNEFPENDKFNIVTAFDVLEHLRQNVFDQTFVTIIKCIYQYGLFILNLPEGRDLTQPLSNLLSVRQILIGCEDKGLRLEKLDRYKISDREIYNFMVFIK